MQRGLSAIAEHFVVLSKIHQKLLPQELLDLVGSNTGTLCTKIVCQLGLMHQSDPQTKFVQRYGSRETGRAVKEEFLHGIRPIRSMVTSCLFYAVFLMLSCVLTIMNE